MKPSRIFSLFSLFLLLAVLFGPGAQPASAGGGGVIFTVNTVNEGSDAALNGICATAGGVCTLRAAIQEANHDPNANTIWFNLPGGGIHVMSITSGALPDITNQIDLNGTSQPSCTVPCIVLSGAIVGGGANGIFLNTNDSRVRGFIVTSWGGYGIQVLGNSNYIQANDIGIWPGNPALLPNAGGLAVIGSSNVIGGTSADLRNVISGNNYTGIVLANGTGLATSGNIILGNYIGTDETGMAARGNAQSGIMLYPDASYTTIGSTILGSANVISANNWAGIDSAGSHTTIRGNLIGTRADGKGSLGNTLEGIRMYGSTAGNYIGGTTGPSKNRIAHNGGDGIVIYNDGNGRTTIRHNSIFSNGGLGIDLAHDGVTANDALDTDAGPNWRQNYPIVASATSSTHVIVARLYTQANSTYTLEFFSSTAGTCDPSGKGEGKTFLGSTTGTTDGTGYVRVVYTSLVAFPAGAVITATATDSTGRTSEFSKCRTAG